MTARVAVGDDDGAVGEPPDQVGVLREFDAVAGRHHDRAGPLARFGLFELRRDPEVSGPQRIVDTQVDRDRTHEVVALLTGVLADGLDEFGAERVFDVGEAGVIGRGEHHGEVVGNDPLTLDVDRTIVVHLPDEAATELDRTDGVARTTEHALDHTLQTTFESLHAHGRSKANAGRRAMDVSPTSRRMEVDAPARTELGRPSCWVTLRHPRCASGGMADAPASGCLLYT